MAWSSWYAYGGDLNETKIIRAAELMVSRGLVAAGYVYLNLDDAWMAPTRDRFGNLYGDPDRFPSGMNNPGVYCHNVETLSSYHRACHRMERLGFMRITVFPLG